MPEPYAIRLPETGGPEVLKTEPLDIGTPGPGEAIVRQTAVGLNFIDTYQRTGLYPGKMPFVPGSEGAGGVEAVGVGEDTAAASLLKGLTAWMLLFEIRPARPGETALVWAAAGGGGSLLVPWAASMGVRVIGVCSTEEMATRVLANGASDVILSSEDVAARTRDLTGGAGEDNSNDSDG